ncbi:MAG: hypothetical protein M0P16_07350 [Syntrophales bacterium]|jgi:hypothetical protein|nr:hypothetical protein [Syntrophales bacterium]MCK9390502.1 hypothetical protein [Syntrophales bacterium]
MSNGLLRIFCVAVFFLYGCVTGATTDRTALVDRISREGKLEKSSLKTSSFTLTAYSRASRPGGTLNLYIEGDGSAWIIPAWRSLDPSPRNPLVLEMAALDPAANVAYLARPGQYPAPDSSRVDPAYWSDKRFAPEVIAAMNEAIDSLKAITGAGKINLVGYSGGAAIAVLITTRRSDIISLRTVAGNLDPEAVNRFHHVSPLTGSLNPMDVADKLKGLPQRHFIGPKDTVIPSFIASSFVKRAGSPDGLEITVVKGASHSKGWREQWKLLLEVPLRSPAGIED